MWIFIFRQKAVSVFFSLREKNEDLQSYQIFSIYENKCKFIEYKNICFSEWFAILWRAIFFAFILCKMLALNVYVALGRLKYTCSVQCTIEACELCIHFIKGILDGNANVKYRDEKKTIWVNLMDLFTWKLFGKCMKMLITFFIFCSS